MTGSRRHVLEDIYGYIGQMDACMHACMHGLMDACMGWLNACMHACMEECMHYKTCTIRHVL